MSGCTWTAAAPIFSRSAAVNRWPPPDQEPSQQLRSAPGLRPPGSAADRTEARLRALTPFVRPAGVKVFTEPQSRATTSMPPAGGGTFVTHPHFLQCGAGVSSAGSGSCRPIVTCCLSSSSDYCMRVRVRARGLIQTWLMSAGRLTADESVLMEPIKLETHRLWRLPVKTIF